MGADLTGANLSFANISYVWMKHADLTNVNMYGAYMERDITTGSDSWTGVYYENTTCPDGNKISPGGHSERCTGFEQSD